MTSLLVICGVSGQLPLLVESGSDPECRVHFREDLRMEEGSDILKGVYSVVTKKESSMRLVRIESLGGRVSL